MNIKVGEGGPRRNIPSAKQSKYQKVYSVIQSDVSVSSVDKDMHCECTGQMEVEKYLRKSCYHRIKYSVVNFLAALMRK